MYKGLQRDVGSWISPNSNFGDVTWGCDLISKVSKGTLAVITLKFLKYQKFNFLKAKKPKSPDAISGAIWI